MEPSGFTERSGIDGAVAKLREELKGAKPKDFAELVIKHLIKKCEESKGLVADICQSHKTWEKCYAYIFENAKKELNNVSGPIYCDIVFKWAEDYYHKDDKAEEEQKVSVPKQKRNGQDVEGQLDMFSILGMREGSTDESV